MTEELEFKDGKTIKHLPRDESGKIKRVFEANGNKYKILNSDSIMSPKKYALFTKMTAAFGFNMGFEGLLKHFDDQDRLILDISPQDSLTKRAALFQNKAIKERVIESIESRYDSILAFCTLFIVREGEDTTEYDEDLANEKMEDWQKEGIAMSNFFFVSASITPAFIEAWQKARTQKQSLDINTILD